MPISKIRQQQLFDQGLCVHNCGRPRLKDMVRCQECRSKSEISRAERQEKKIAQGLCIRDKCTNKTEPGYRTCKECIARANVRAKQRYAKCRAAKLCYRCGAETDGRVYCAKHRSTTSRS